MNPSTRPISPCRSRLSGLLSRLFSDLRTGLHVSERVVLSPVARPAPTVRRDRRVLAGRLVLRVSAGLWEERRPSGEGGGREGGGGRRQVEKHSGRKTPKESKCPGGASYVRRTGGGGAVWGNWRRDAQLKEAAKARDPSAEGAEGGSEQHDGE